MRYNKISSMPVAVPRQRVRVWDLPTRLFHWFLVLLVTVGVASAYLAPEWWMDLHIGAGYGVVLLIVFRLIWGVVGSEYSRISNFSYSPGETFRHLHGLAMLRPPHYLGHNPTGALMVFALFLVLVGITLSGLLALGGEENQGPLAGITSFQIGDISKDIHAWLVIILGFMVVAHLSGVTAESLLHRENLPRSMFHGYKSLPEGLAHPPAREAQPGMAILIIVVFGLSAAGILGLLGRMPPTGLQALPANENFQTECADCHQLYHPSLLPAASWQGLMGNLEDHFGEDASLDEETGKDIASYLVSYASEGWDTEAANRLREVSADSPWQISASPYWVRKHDEISPSLFARADIGSKSNCAACHTDAGSGRFDDQMINILEKEK